MLYVFPHTYVLVETYDAEECPRLLMTIRASPGGYSCNRTTCNLVTLWLSQYMSNSYSYYRKFGNAYSFQGSSGVNTDLVELNG